MVRPRAYRVGEIKALAEGRLDNLSPVIPLQAFRQCRHGGGFAVDQCDRWVAGDLTIPVDQAILIGMGGQTPEGMNLSFDLDHFAPQADITGAVHERPSQRALGLKARDDHVRVFPPDVMF